MMTILYVVIVVVGLIIIWAYGQRRGEAQGPLVGTGWVAVLLLAPVLGGKLGISVLGQPEVTVPLALFAIGALFIEESHDLKRFYVTRENLGLSLLYGAAISCVVVVPFSLYLVYSRAGQIRWLPGQQVVLVIVKTVLVALAEEFTFRSVFMRYLRERSLAPIVANAVQTVYFALGHGRYIQSGDYLFFGFVLVFGWLAGWITLRQKNVAGAVLVHVAVNFVPLLINGGQMP